MIRYPHLIAFRAVQPMADAIAELAERDCASPADTCRRLILAGLRANGFEFGSMAQDGSDREPPKIPPLEPTGPRKRGRPRKRAEGQTFGLTVRMDGDLRSKLRRMAEVETDRRGAVVTLNDLMVEAAAAASAGKAVML
jgi:hypothetical protein